MLKFISYIFIIFLIVGCKSSSKIVAEAKVNNDLEPGKCYFTILEESKTGTEKSFIIEIKPTKYQEVDVYYSNEELEKYKIENDKYYLPFRPRHLKFVFHNEMIPEYTRIDNPVGYMFCLIEVPATSSGVVTKQELIEKGNKVKQIKILEHSKLLKKYSNRKPRNLNENQYFFERGDWTELKQVNKGS